MKVEEMAKQKAEEIANKRCNEIMCYGHCSFNSPKHHRCGEWHREYNCALDGYHEGFKDCAKARLNVTTISDCPIKDEWHYVKDGELPKEDVYWSNDLIFITKDCVGNITKHFGYFLSIKEFEEYNTGHRFVPDRVIAWKEIVPPELSEEIK